MSKAMLSHKFCRFGVGCLTALVLSSSSALAYYDDAEESSTATNNASHVEALRWTVDESSSVDVPSFEDDGTIRSVGLTTVSENNLPVASIGDTALLVQLVDDMGLIVAREQITDFSKDVTLTLVDSKKTITVSNISPSLDGKSISFSVHGYRFNNGDSEQVEAAIEHHPSGSYLHERAVQHLSRNYSVQFGECGLDSNLRGWRFSYCFGRSSDWNSGVLR